MTVLDDRDHQWQRALAKAIAVFGLYAGYLETAHVQRAPFGLSARARATGPGCCLLNPARALFGCRFISSPRSSPDALSARGPLPLRGRAHRANVRGRWELLGRKKRVCRCAVSPEKDSTAHWSRAILTQPGSRTDSDSFIRVPAETAH